MNLSDLERRDARGHFFHADLYRTVWPRTSKFGRVTHVGRGILVGVSYAIPQGAASQRSSILEVPFYLCVHLLLQNYQIWRSNTYVGRDVLGSATPPIPRHRSFSESKFLGFSCIYLCLHPLTQNDKFSIVTHMGRGVFLGGQPRHCICTDASRGLSAIAYFLGCLPLQQVDCLVGWCANSLPDNIVSSSSVMGFKAGVSKLHFCGHCYC